VTGRPPARPVQRNTRDPLARAFDVLDAFPETPIGLSELARRSGLSKTTTHRLVAQLVRHGAVERVPGGLRLGLRLFELGQRVPGLQPLRSRATASMYDLLAMSGETVHLAIRDGTEVVYVEKLVGSRGTLAPSRRGGRMPLQDTAVGKALVAHLAADELDDLLGQVSTKLAADLADVRRHGFAVSIEELEPGLVCVGAPILGRDGEPMAALSIAGRNASVGRGAAAAVLSAARRLTHTMAADCG
jgi:IclR family transcriptional regulator, acetate operon repressor